MAAFAIAFVFAGCGGLQSPSGAPGMPPSVTAPRHDGRHRSWMLPEARGENLVYVSDTYDFGVVGVYAYPSLKPVGTLAEFTGGICSDKAGNVFLINANSSIVEYAHASLVPKATLSVHRHQPLDCAVDPNTDTLAVTTDGPGPSLLSVAMFLNETGRPKFYDYIDHEGNLGQCAYDDRSNLFISAYDGGSYLTEIRSGAKVFHDLRIKGSYGTANFGAVQWDGNYITVAEGTYDTDTLDRLVVKGETAKIVGQTVLNDSATGPSIAFNGGKVIAGGSGITLGIWKYPAGGNPITTNYDAYPSGLALSPAPKH